MPLNGQQKCNAIADEVLGSRCILCGASLSRRLVCHEIHGLPHPKMSRLGLAKFREIISSTAPFYEFVRVCYIEHKHIHWAMEHLHMSWPEIYAQYKK